MRRGVGRGFGRVGRGCGWGGLRGVCLGMGEGGGG